MVKHLTFIIMLPLSLPPPAWQTVRPYTPAPAEILTPKSFPPQVMIIRTVYAVNAVTAE